MSAIDTTTSTVPSESKGGMFTLDDGRNLAFTFILLSSLFLLWGFCNGMIDVMDKHFQDELHLSKAQSAWVQFAHYLGYFLMAIPAGWLAAKLGYKGGIIVGLLIVALGGMWFIPATEVSLMAKQGVVSNNVAFAAFLAGVCLIATGLTFLETVANPYATVLGSRKYAATRINLAQSCNGVGWIFGPIVGSMFFYATDAAGNSTGAETLFIPYVSVAVVVAILAVVFYFSSIPDLKPAEDYAPVEEAEEKHHSVWKHPHFAFSVLAQFLYVAAQAGIFSFFINYITEELPAIPSAWQNGFDSFAANAGILSSWLSGWFLAAPDGAVAFTDKGASNLASFGFVLFLLGRFSGSLLLKRFQAHSVLSLYGFLCALASLLVFLKLGWTSAVCVLLTFFFMSIMFPTIFALGIFGLGGRAKRASAFLVMAVSGGAVVPKIMGAIADHYDMSRGFIVPALCFIVVGLYGLYWQRLSHAPSTARIQTSGGH
ncbi:MAG: MFS transporter [Bryobacterales bacterium]|nr:MFS transporter [Bryobacterales bacterium]